MASLQISSASFIEWMYHFWYTTRLSHLQKNRAHCPESVPRPCKLAVNFLWQAWGNLSLLVSLCNAAANACFLLCPHEPVTSLHSVLVVTPARAAFAQMSQGTATSPHCQFPAVPSSTPSSCHSGFEAAPQNGNTWGGVYSFPDLFHSFPLTSWPWAKVHV